MSLLDDYVHPPHCYACDPLRATPAEIPVGCTCAWSARGRGVTVPLSAPFKGRPDPDCPYHGM